MRTGGRKERMRPGGRKERMRPGGRKEIGEQHQLTIGRWWWTYG
jgi:hypothetical protein